MEPIKLTIDSVKEPSVSAIIDRNVRFQLWIEQLSKDKQEASIALAWMANLVVSLTVSFQDITQMTVTSSQQAYQKHIACLDALIKLDEAAFTLQQFNIITRPGYTFDILKAAECIKWIAERTRIPFLRLAFHDFKALPNLKKIGQNLKTNTGCICCSAIGACSMISQLIGTGYKENFDIASLLINKHETISDAERQLLTADVDELAKFPALSVNSDDMYSILYYLGFLIRHEACVVFLNALPDLPLETRFREPEYKYFTDFVDTIQQTIRVLIAIVHMVNLQTVTKSYLLDRLTETDCPAIYRTFHTILT